MSAADTLEMSEPLRARGFAAAPSPDEADVLLVSTCTVRQHAEDRALSLIGSLRPWKEADPRRVLIVAGCAAERLKDWLCERFPHVDLVVGAKSIAEFPRLVEQALGARFDALAETRQAFKARPIDAASPVVAPVTVMRGCNYSCSYCIVPSVRGRELYRPVADILAEAGRKVAAGAREVLLLGQTVNSYRSESGGRPVRFADLLRLVDRIPEVRRLRFMSPHPHFVDDALLGAMAECPSVCPALHLPAQSGSDRILGLMRRNYTRASFLRRADAARRAVPGIVFSTDIIVGFPTETDEDFQETLSLVTELQPTSSFCFKYSPRESTEAARRRDDVSAAVKAERLSRLNELTQRLTREHLRSRVGGRVSALAEAPGYGRTREGFHARWTPGAGEAAGAVVTLRVRGATRKTLLGEPDASR